MPRLHREECGALGCGFVAGPSRDLNRVQRIVDQHRAGHRLDVEALTAPKRRPVEGSQAEYRRRQHERAQRIVAHLATYRRFGEVEWRMEPRPERPERDYVAERRQARQRRDAEMSARLSELAALAVVREDDPPPRTPGSKGTGLDRKDRRRRAAEARRPSLVARLYDSA